MGIRRRVRRSFFALATILIFAGFTSYFELALLSNSSKRAINTGAESVRISTEIIDLTTLHNDIFYEYSQNKDIEKLKVNSEKILFSLDSISSAAMNNPYTNEYFAKLTEDIDKYKKGVRNFHTSDYNRVQHWYHLFQSDVYFALIESVKQYILSTQKFVVNETTTIDIGIYRSIMLGVVAIICMIIILAIFFVLLDIYYLKPVTKLTKSLNGYVISKIPFTVKVDGKDEVYKLKELILDLISANKTVGKGQNNLFNKE